MSLKKHNAGRVVLTSLGTAMVVMGMTMDWWLENSSPGIGPAQLLSMVIGGGLTVLGVSKFADRVPRLLINLCMTLLMCIIMVLIFEALSRYFEFDFDKRKEVFQRVPIYYRQPIQPVGSVYFKHPGPAVWKGKVLIFEGGEEVTVTYDSQGFRNPEALADWDIVVVGDSFVELGYLSYQDLFSTQIGYLLKARVKNLGVSYTGPLTHLFYLKEYGKAPSLKQVIWIFFEGNDIQDLEREWNSLQKFKSTGMREYRDIDKLKKQTSFINACYALYQKYLVNGVVGILGKFGRYQAGGNFQANAYFKSQEGEILLNVREMPLGKNTLTSFQDALLDSVMFEWSEYSRSIKVTPFLVYMPSKRRVLDRYLRFVGDTDKKIITYVVSDLPDLIKSFCKNHAIEFIDVTPLLVKEASKGVLTYNIIDDHLNSKGSAVVAHAIADELQAYLEINRTNSDRLPSKGE